jgi:hypothetical protein
VFYQGYFLHPNIYGEIKNGFENRLEQACNADTSLGKVFGTKTKGFIPFSEYLIGSLKEHAHFQNMQEQFLNKHARPKNAFYPKKVSSI